MKVDGGCHCGSITFEAEIDPAAVALCHGTDCQRLSGTAFRGGGPDARGPVHPALRSATHVRQDHGERRPTRAGVLPRVRHADLRDVDGRRPENLEPSRGHLAPARPAEAPHPRSGSTKIRGVSWRDHPRSDRASGARAQRWDAEPSKAGCFDPTDLGTSSDSRVQEVSYLARDVIRVILGKEVPRWMLRRTNNKRGSRVSGQANCTCVQRAQRPVVHRGRV